MTDKPATPPFPATDKKIRSGKFLLLACSLMAVRPSIAFATTGCVSENIQISVVNNSLDFGSLVACPGAAGSVTVQDNGSLQLGGGSCITTTTGNVQTAAVRVTAGQDNKDDKVVMTITSAPTTNITHTTQGIQQMTVSSFDQDFSGNSPTTTLDGTAVATVNIGAKLTIGAGQAAGSYQGATQINVTCQ